MASFSTWAAWLRGLVSGLWPAPPAPGTHEACLEEDLTSALLGKELSKPAGQRDEERVHALRVDYRRRQLVNLQAQAAAAASKAAGFEQPVASVCCDAAGWVRRRLAASFWAQSDYLCQHIAQVKEELAAAEARRPAMLAAEPTLRLDLPAALQQHPPRLDMCSACAERIQSVELDEEALRVHGDALRNSLTLRGLQRAPAAVCASAAAGAPTGEAQLLNQQGQQQQQGDSRGGCAEGAPGTPKQSPPRQQKQQQQQTSSSGQEQEQRQE